MGNRRRRAATEIGVPRLIARLRLRAGGFRRSTLVKCTSGVFFVLALLSVSCTESKSTAPPTDVELRIGVPEGNTDRTELGVPQLARNMRLEALTQISSEGRAVPRLAESWSWEDDGRRLRVRLRSGITLHDGTQLNASIVAKALAEAVADPTNRDSSPSFVDLVRMTPAGDRDLVLELTRPSPHLPIDLTVLLDVPAGPFQIVKDGKERIEMTRFDRFYQGAPAIARIDIRKFDALRTAWASLLRGELDMVYDVPVDAEEFVRNDDIDVISVPRWYQHELILNVHDRRFASPLVRRALNLAIDRAAIVRKVLHGAGEPSGGPVYPGFWAFDASVPKYSFDPAAAAALLDAAGYRMPKGSGSGTAAPARFRFTCLLPRNFAIWERIALEIQKDLFNIGVDMQFKVVPDLREFSKVVFSGKLEAAFVNMISGPTPSRSYMWWRSTQAFRGQYNVFGYESAQAEQLFDVLIRSTNDAAIRSATAKLQRVLYDDPPAVYVAWDTRTRAISRRFVLPRDERDPMWAMWKWTLASHRNVAVNR